jgi:hypothetical protein
MKAPTNNRRGDQTNSAKKRTLAGTAVHSAKLIGNTKLGAEAMFDQSKGKVRTTTNQAIKKARK